MYADFDDAFMKAQFFLKKVQEAITHELSNSNSKRVNEFNYQDIYLNLYSFSTKLNLLRE